MRGNTAVVKKTKPVKILRRGKSAVTDGTVADFFECFTQVDARLRARLGGEIGNAFQKFFLAAVFGVYTEKVAYSV